MSRNRGPLAHVQIDDGEDSEWDTVTEVNNASKSHQRHVEDSPRDDDTSYQQSSIDIPFVADNISANQKSQVNPSLAPPDNVSVRRQSTSSASSRRSRSSEQIPATDFVTTKQPDPNPITKPVENAPRTSVKYKPSGASGGNHHSQSQSVASRRSISPRSEVTISKTSNSALIRKAGDRMLDGEPASEFDKMHNMSEHSIAISDSGVEIGHGAVVIEAKDGGNNNGKNKQRRWSKILVPPAIIQKNGVMAAKFSAAINQPMDEEFDGENYFDLFRQSRWEYQFAHSNSGADRKFVLPRENPKPKMFQAVEKVEVIAQRSVAEICGTIRLVFAVIIAIVVETVRTVLGGLVQPLIVGTVTVVGSYLLQPILVALFNHIIAPLLSFMHNIFSATMRSFQPFFVILSSVFGTIAELLQSFRLVDVNLASRDVRCAGNETPTGQLQTV